jgi:PAS domain S-box-containing protein
VLADDGVVVDVNPAWQRLIGRGRAELVGVALADVVAPADDDGECRVVHADGTERWVRLREHAGATGRWVVGQDVTRERADRRQLAEYEREARALIAALQEGLCLLDADGRIRQVNDHLCRMVDLPGDEVLGRTVPDALFAPEVRARDAEALRELLTLGGGRMVAKLGGSGGRRVSVAVEVSPVEGDGAGHLVTLRDITRDLEELRRLQAMQTRLGEAQAAAQIATWEWRPETDELITSPELPELAGLPRDALSSMRAAARIVPPAWREELAAGLAAVAGGASRFEVWHPVDVPDPGVRWLELIAWPVHDPDGRVACVRGTSQNVTAEQRANEEAELARDFYQATLDSMTAHIAVLDESGDVIAANDAWDRFSAENGGSPEATGVGTNYLRAAEAGGDPVGIAVAEGLRAMLRGERDAMTREYACHGPDRLRWFELKATPFAGAGARRLVVRHEDVTARRRAEEDARVRAGLLDVLDAAVISLDASWRVTEWNAAAERLYGWTRQDAIGRLARELVVPERQLDAAETVRTTLAQDGSWHGEFELRHRDGTTFSALVHNTAIRDDDGAVIGYVGLSVDMTERKRAERDLRSAQQYLKAVTDSMGEGVCTLDEGGRLVYMNPAAEGLLGWGGTDLVGQVLHEVLHYRRADGSALPREDSALHVVLRDRQVVHVDDDHFVRRDGDLLPVEYSVAPLDTADGTRGAVVVFKDNTARKAERDRLAREVDALTWVTRIREALQHDRFRLHAQPIIDLATGDVVQHELLIRMLDDDGGIIPPGAFLPVAEQYGLIGEIDRWVIARAAEIAGRGHPVEFNMSAESLGDPAFADLVRSELERTGADPADVVIELTETAILRDEEAGRAFLDRVSALGCKVALDDFGTGYGGFTYLKRLPVDYLKIDIEFVRDLPRDPASQQVVRAVAMLAAGLGKQTVAEGVEDEETLELLRRFGVDHAQGYGIGRPAPVEERLRP